MSKKILFQGDSITDCGRIREQYYDMGAGYAFMVKATLGLENPNDYEYINRGIGGNRIVDVYARIKNDFINIKPDYASILVGVNDTWHEIGSNDGTDSKKFEKLYCMLLDEVLEACPNIKLILMSPYVLPGYATCNIEEKPNRLEQFQKDVAEKAEVVKKIAEKYNLPLIELQPAFDEACKKAPAAHWAYDGVHPTPCGHEIIKRLWLETFEKIK